MEKVQHLHNNDSKKNRKNRREEIIQANYPELKTEKTYKSPHIEENKPMCISR